MFYVRLKYSRAFLLKHDISWCLVILLWHILSKTTARTFNYLSHTRLTSDFWSRHCLSFHSNWCKSLITRALWTTQQMLFRFIIIDEHTNYHKLTIYIIRPKKITRHILDKFCWLTCSVVLLWKFMQLIFSFQTIIMTRQKSKLSQFPPNYQYLIPHWSCKYDDVFLPHRFYGALYQNAIISASHHKFIYYSPKI